MHVKNKTNIKLKYVFGSQWNIQFAVKNVINAEIITKENLSAIKYNKKIVYQKKFHCNGHDSCKFQ